MSGKYEGEIIGEFLLTKYEISSGFFGSGIRWHPKINGSWVTYATANAIIRRLTFDNENVKKFLSDSQTLHQKILQKTKAYAESNIKGYGYCQFTAEKKRVKDCDCNYCEALELIELMPEEKVSSNEEQ